MSHDHPGDNTLAACLAGALDAAGAARVHDHIDTCASCRDLLADAGRDQGEAAPRPGDRLGRYLIGRVVGVGGIGVVYEAHDPILDRRVAVKLLRPDVLEPSADLVAEAQAMARLRHPNVAVVYDVGRHGRRAFVCLEYIDGRTLRAWLDETRPHWRAVAKALLAAGRGLAYVHAAGLVHLDFKPDNVMVARDGTVVVTDFGLARITRGRAEPQETGLVVGTPAYMAPEQRRGERVDARADQYSFCLAAAEALAAGGRLPSPLGRALARGRANDPGDRWTCLEPVLRAFEECLRPRGRARASVAAVGLASAALVTGLVVAATHPAVVFRTSTRWALPTLAARVTEARSVASPASRPMGSRTPAPGPDARAAPPLSPRRVPTVPALLAALRSEATGAVLPEPQPPARLLAAAGPALAPRHDPATARGGADDGAVVLSRCDDGGGLVCDLDEPACPPGTVAAVRAGCWTCADRLDCLPLGLPHACDDGTELMCRAERPRCGAHQEPAIRQGCWACADVFHCRGRPPPRKAPTPAPSPQGEVSAATCGNFMCEAGEDHTGCPSDCCEVTADGACVAECGNGMCEAGEGHASCASDCCETTPTGACMPVCGNGFCEVGEDAAGCPSDC